MSTGSSRSLNGTSLPPWYISRVTELKHFLHDIKSHASREGIAMASLITCTGTAL